MIRISALKSMLLLVVLLVCSVAFADSELCDQLSNITPMPGGGVAINPQGDMDGLGAFQINIPIAYTPKSRYIDTSFFVGGVPSTDDTLNNYTGIAGGSMGGFPRLWLSAMAVSKDDVTANAQLLLVKEQKYVPSVSVGVEDIFQSEDCGFIGHVILTKNIPAGEQNFYYSIGYRQDDFIGGISAPLGKSFNLAVEWDGFQFNSALIWRPKGQNGHLTLLGGYEGQAGPIFGLSYMFRVRD